ncbi:hypothetical protein [Vibrio campbellii]|uniref:hypothetical protein n=1 Tax=Vibrio campbellii TaxID=680 RepID=UPI00142E0BDF|nr:hypothetical protein [Vibrio campbellii]NIY89261.1 hypothetical protein [Vibrio campbellii]NVK69985.1 hypothetical protein [Vibrio campbellii]
MIDRIDRLISNVMFRALLFLILIAYVYFMIFEPLLYPLNGEIGHWQNLLNTWEVWQSFNAAVIAFVAALFAIYATRQTELRQERRKRTIAKLRLNGAIEVIQNQLLNYASQLRISIKDCTKSSPFDTSLISEQIQTIDFFLEHAQQEDALATEHLEILIQAILYIRSRSIMASHLVECDDDFGESLNEDGWVNILDDVKPNLRMSILRTVRLTAALEQFSIRNEPYNMEHFKTWSKRGLLYTSELDLFDEGVTIFAIKNGEVGD